MGNSQCCAADGNNAPRGPVQEIDYGDTKASKPIPKGFVLLHGCTTMEEHEDHILADLNIVGFQSNTNHNDVVRLRGEEGLRAIGFEFRFVPCAKHAKGDTTCGVHTEDNSSTQEDIHSKDEPKRVRFDFSTKNTDERVGWHSCKDCVTRLVYVGKHVQIDVKGTPEGAVVSDKNDSLKVCSTQCIIDGKKIEGKVDKEMGVDKTSTPCTKNEGSEEATSSPSKISTPQDFSPKVTKTVELDNLCTTTNLQNEESAATISTSQTTTAQPSVSTLQPIAITPQNKSLYIADGLHYELLSTLCQEAAHEIMCRTFNLEWVTLCTDESHDEQIKALVDANHPLDNEEREVVEKLSGFHLENVHEDEKKEKDESTSEEECIPRKNSTLLIATGRGKVRAGIFSRFHLLTAGIEVGTAWHNIREAQIRDMGVVIIDPNARGEEEGMETFKRSVLGLFSRAASKVRSMTSTHETAKRQSSQIDHTSIYILAHSASGGQLVRHLRDDPSLLPSIRAVAFTDSTHNIQWCKDNPSLMQFFSTKKCVYLRSNDVRTSQSCIHVSSRGKDIACQCINCNHNRKNAGVVADVGTYSTNIVYC